MLVLSRKSKESVTIDGAITLAVLAINHNLGRICLAILLDGNVEFRWCSRDDKFDVGGLGIVTVIEIRFDKCRLGFDFPKKVDVDRLEITERKLGIPRDDLRRYIDGLSLPPDILTVPKESRLPANFLPKTLRYSESA